MLSRCIRVLVWDLVSHRQVRSAEVSDSGFENEPWEVWAFLLEVVVTGVFFRLWRPTTRSRTYRPRSQLPRTTSSFVVFWVWYDIMRDFWVMTRKWKLINFCVWVKSGSGIQSNRRLSRVWNLLLPLIYAPVSRTPVPNFTKPFTIQCDAGEKALGGVLTQVDGVEQPFAYISRTLNPPERNYIP